jgi:hypothetical protein
MTYRQIHVEIWDDPWFVELDPQEKLLFVYLFSNSRTNAIGLYELTERVMAFETGLPSDMIHDALERFHTDGKAYYEGSWLWVPKLLTRNVNNLGSPKIRAMIERLLKNIPDDCPFKADWLLYFNQVVAPQYHIDTMPHSIDTMSPPQIHSVLWCDCVDPDSVSDLYSVSVSVKGDGEEAKSDDGNALDALLKLRGGAMNPLDVDQVNDLVDEFEKHRQALPRASPGAECSGDRWVKTAILEANAARKGGRVSLNYIKAILDRWRTDGYQAKRGDPEHSVAPDGRTVIKVQP